MEGGNTTAARKVMVVADPTRESAGALQYALSHAIVESDTLILFHVESPNAWRINPLSVLFRKPNSGGGVTSIYQMGSPGAVAAGGGGGTTGEFLDAMKEACKVAQPKVKVVVAKAEMGEGKDKASVILGMSTAYKVDLLIIGHSKRPFSNSILGVKRAVGSFRDTAENLIFNSKCSCVAVQKSQNGGYLLSSKQHKNFWVLA